MASSINQTIDLIEDNKDIESRNALNRTALINEHQINMMKSSVQGEEAQSDAANKRFPSYHNLLWKLPDAKMSLPQRFNGSKAYGHPCSTIISIISVVGTTGLIWYEYDTIGRYKEFSMVKKPFKTNLVLSQENKGDVTPFQDQGITYYWIFHTPN